MNYSTKLPLQAMLEICDWIYLPSVTIREPGPNIWSDRFQTLHIRFYRTMISKWSETKEMSSKVAQNLKVKRQILIITMVLWSWRNWSSGRIEVTWICRKSYQRVVSYLEKSEMTSSESFYEARFTLILILDKYIIRKWIYRLIILISISTKKNLIKLSNLIKHHIK